jgi:deoxycytidine triphosphate deaminase
MSVLQIKGRTTNSITDFDTYALSSNSYIFTTAAEPNIEEFSIELTLGEGWNDNFSPNNKNLKQIVDGITIRGHSSIVVEVHEEIRIPHNRYGIVLPTGSLFLSRGVLIASAKVEPAFIGKLKLRIFNTTNQKILLRKGEKLGSIIFFSTESTNVHEFTYRMSEISASPMSRLAESKKWLVTNKMVLIGWLISAASSSLVVFCLTYSLYYKPMLKMQNAPLQQTMKNPQGQDSKVNTK